MIKFKFICLSFLIFLYCTLIEDCKGNDLNRGVNLSTLNSYCANGEETDSLSNLAVYKLVCTRNAES